VEVELRNSELGTAEVEAIVLVVFKDDGRELEPSTAYEEELRPPVIADGQLEPTAVDDDVELANTDDVDEALEMAMVVEPVAPKSTEKLDVPAIAEGFKDDDGVVEKLLAGLATVELGDDDPDADVPVGDTLVADDPAEDESIGPEPAREDDVDSAREDVNAEDVIKAERLKEESE
jgi:hypothetical protein